VEVGLLFFGANVAEHWVTECKYNNFTKAGIQLVGYSEREARPVAARGTKPAVNQPVLTDAAGNEIFYEQIPKYAQNERMLPCPPYCAPNNTAATKNITQKRMVGGGGPSVR
jgi:hypothetical protein